MRTGECPSCGATLTFKNKASLYAVCGACGNMAVQKAENLQYVGNAGQLVENFSPIQMGTRGKYQNRDFEVIGRIQINYQGGFWNEWHLDLAGESAWLGEANGLYTVTRLIPLKPDSLSRIPEFNQIIAGMLIRINDTSLYVKDKQPGKVVSGEGELPFSFKTEYEAPVIDLLDRAQNFYTLDYSESPPLLYFGRTVEFFELQFTNLKRVPGFKEPLAS